MWSQLKYKERDITLNLVEFPGSLVHNRSETYIEELQTWWNIHATNLLLVSCEGFKWRPSWMGPHLKIKQSLSVNPPIKIKERNIKLYHVNEEAPEYRTPSEIFIILHIKRKPNPPSVSLFNQFIYSFPTSKNAYLDQDQGKVPVFMTWQIHDII